MKPTVFAIAITCATLTTMTGCTLTRGGYESAPYRAVRHAGHYEVRDYPSLTVVETPMQETGAGGAGGGFGRLFRFISGHNAQEQKIAMTTPIFMSGREGDAMMAFVMPANRKPDDLPKPDDETLKVRQMPNGRFAVLRFSGRRSREREDQALQQLETWMRGNGLVPEGSPVFAYFDPPWTLLFLRRNEVMLRTRTLR